MMRRCRAAREEGGDRGEFVIKKGKVVGDFDMCGYCNEHVFLGGTMEDPSLPVECVSPESSTGESELAEEQHAWQSPLVILGGSRSQRLS